MKIYPKTYEDVIRHRQEPRHYQYLGSDIGTLEEFIKMEKKMDREITLGLFDFYVRFYWLKRRITIKGKSVGDTSFIPAIQGSVEFLYNVKIGTQKRSILETPGFRAVTSYFEDFFPNFDEHNPFTEKEYYEFPYKHINLDMLYFVYHMDERFEFLKKAEEEEMKYHDFVNYVYNWAQCHNDEIGEEKYGLYDSKSMFYIKNLRNKRNIKTNFRKSSIGRDLIYESFYG